MSGLWQLGALHLAVGARFTDLRCPAVAEQIQGIVGPPEPTDPVTA